MSAPEAPRAPAADSLSSNWKSDLISGFLVFLIALPLCLGIAKASEFPPIAGIITAVVGGCVATWVGSARLTIKGPAAGLIVIALGASTDLGYRKALAAIVAAAVIQIVFALVRAGKLGDFFPASVVHGMLAAIGIIILSKQVHFMLGVQAKGEPLHLLLQIPNSVMHMNPEIALIGVLSLAVLFTFPLLQKKYTQLQKIPGPMLVLALAVPLGYAFDLDREHTYSFPLTHQDYTLKPADFLVTLPGSLLKAVTTPDFSAVFTGPSIKYIVMFTLVGSLESLLSAKAVDSLDPKKRRSNLDRDLLAMGVGNLIAGLIGGLPMISEIVRSSANISYGAKSKLSNFFHGLFLLLFVAFLPGLIHRIPVAALAAMLVFTGVRLASPKEFAKTYKIGAEQLFIFSFTTIVTVATDLLVGVGAGIVLKMIIHVVNGAPASALFRPEIEEKAEGDHVHLTVKHAAVFSNYLAIKGRLDKHAAAKSIVVDFADARLVDHTVMEKLHELEDEYKREGRKLEVTGLDGHKGLSTHPLAARKKVEMAAAGAAR